MLLNITDLEEFKAILDNDINPIVVDFTAHGIQVKVDVNSANEVATDCAIKELPTFQFYLRRDKIFELTGADKDALKRYLDSCVVKAELQKEFDDFDVSDDSADY
ncbi:hypothetical protein CTEN210_14223 [Chaetoceros tenuissimus]|uniref:Thioredoxin domain-containing protein n=1 Tax=Chaetoceros tenuissimus TaxID=426638 RepID=A0AAD3D4H9_9STRA|nr:hypothetical protein CTEN210_14223 [Chaetoceros tenuissimus]